MSTKLAYYAHTQLGERRIATDFHRRGRQHERIAALINFLWTHHDADRVQLANIAAEMDVTESYLSRAIHTETGLSFAVLLSTIRVVKAIALLSSSDMSIKAVSQTVGYRRCNELERQFSRLMHMCPSAFRAAIRCLPHDVFEHKVQVAR